MADLQVADHGLIGDLRTAALVGTDGTIDWFCAPRFDSPSVFAAVLDADEGGHWKMAPAIEGATRQQFYFPDSNILITRFLTEEGVVEIEDFMPIRKARDERHRERIVRRVRSVRGSMEMTTEVAPRFDYARGDHELEAIENGVQFSGEELVLQLHASVELELDDRDVRASFRLSDGAAELFVLDVMAPGEDTQLQDPAHAETLFEETVRFWRDWLSQSTYGGRWRETVHRSALTLKLLTHEPTGALVAGPTTSLPERIGGERNWDYRYVWIRDAAFSLYALLRMGFTDEAAGFMGWLTDRFGDASDGGENGPLKVLYTIDGETPPEEFELDHLSGHRGSRPVRVGNAAVDQLQLDIYGELIDSVYLFNKYGPGISAEAWDDLVELLGWVSENWDQPDEGIWEPRAARQDHTYSRLMCWVAIERMVRVARQRGLPGDLDAWMATRDEIYRQIMERGWSTKREAFVQSYDDGDTVDASLLLMPMVKFLAPNDPRFLSTLAAIDESLVTDSLVFRYDPAASPDGLDGAEGTFSICSFWYVEALTRAGRLDEARLALEKMFTYANHVGLYAEQIGLAGDQLGNFPQAFTHLALISAAINLDRALS